METLLRSDDVQVVALLFIFIALAWLGREVKRHGEMIVDLQARVGNHHEHRFKQIAALLGVEQWDEEDVE